MDMGRLVRMANEIARFYTSQSGDAAAATAAHLDQFWEARMRLALKAHLATGGAGLDPVARDAARLMR